MLCVCIYIYFISVPCKMRLAKLVHSLVARRWMCKNLFRIVINFLLFLLANRKNALLQDAQSQGAFFAHVLPLSHSSVLCWGGKAREKKTNNIDEQTETRTILKIVGTENGFKWVYANCMCSVSTFRTRNSIVREDLLTWNQSRLIVWERKRFA